MEAGAFRCSSCGRVNRVDPSRSAPKCGACHGDLDLSNHPFLISDDGLDTLVAQSPVPVLVDFYADWCGPCRSLAPVLVELAKRNAGRLLVAKVDTEEHRRKTSELGVQGIPALFVFKDGQLVTQTAGARPLADMQRMLDAFLAET